MRFPFVHALDTAVRIERQKAQAHRILDRIERERHRYQAGCQRVLTQIQRDHDRMRQVQENVIKDMNRIRQAARRWQL